MIKKLSRILAILILAASTLAVIPPPRAQALQQDSIVYGTDVDRSIVSINPDGSNRQVLSQGYYPQISPNGEKIAFINNDSGVENLYVMSADGSDVVNLTGSANTQSIDLHFTWSPDSQNLAYTKIITTESPGGPISSSRIFTTDVDGGTQIDLTADTEEPHVHSPSWSADGNKIAYTSVEDNVASVYTMSADGNNKTQLVFNASLPQWAPSGNKISFESDFADEFGDAEVGTINSDGSGLTAVTNNTGFDGQEKWSPDGSRLLMLSNCNCGDPTYIRTINPDGSNSSSVISPNEGGDIAYPSWSPDSSHIVFTGYDPAGGEPLNYHLFTVPAAGGSATQVYADNDGAIYPVWGQLGAAQNDTTAPTVSTFTLNRKTSVQTENFAVTASDAESGVASSEFYYGADPGQGNGTQMAYDGAQLHGTLGTDMPVGTYQVYVRAVDNAGNWSDSVGAKLVVTQTGTTRVTASGSFTPSTANGDQLPALGTSSFKLAQYNQNVSFGNNGIVNSSSANFTYTYGSSVLCGLLPTLPQCHRLTFAASGNTSITSLVFTGTNNSQATVTGTAQVTVDGVTTTNPFTITAISSARAGSGINSYQINIYNPGSTIAPQNLLYKAANTGTVTIQ
jgi:Tol biopolymer transport system component